MKTRDFFFDLPRDLIAQEPSGQRGAARLLVLDRASGLISHHRVSDLPRLLDDRFLLVFNDTRVRRARIFGRGARTGAETEFLLVETRDRVVWKVLCGRRKKKERDFLFPEGVAGEVSAEDGIEKTLTFNLPIEEGYLDRHGHVPLPPYIEREDGEMDAERYQTVYARHTGAAAAPTAGLHFTPGLLQELRGRGIATEFLTLHVGLGTFLPVKTEEVEDHRMHEESYEITAAAAEGITAARAAGKKILAVGTTSLRALESAANPVSGAIKAGEGRTSIFIYPGYRFKATDALFTNFHTPESTLLMLVSAFAGQERVKKAYEEAVTRGYRFFSYGDAMLIL